MKIRGNFYISYKTHNFCINCDDGHKSGFILKKDCIGVSCPKCGNKLRTHSRSSKSKYSGGRY